MTGEPMVPGPDTINVDAYTVHAAVLYGERTPDGVGAVVVCLAGVCNGTGERVEQQITIHPEGALTLARALRQAFQRVPVERRHQP